MRKVEQFLLANQPKVDQEKPKKVRSKELNVLHNVIYRERRKNGIKPARKPWDFLTSHEVKKMAWTAHKVASWYLREDALAKTMPHVRLREEFAVQLGEMFTSALLAHAVQEGDCWPVEGETPFYRDYVQVWKDLSHDVPYDWYPQYPLQERMPPASARNTPGGANNADEGNVNDHDFTS